MRSSTPAIAGPTVPNRERPGWLAASDRRGLGQAVALVESAGRRRAKNSPVSRGSGALPATMRRSRPPRRAAPCANTSRSASRSRQPAGVERRPARACAARTRASAEAQRAVRNSQRRTAPTPAATVAQHAAVQLLEHARHDGHQRRRRRRQVAREGVEVLGEDHGDADDQVGVDHRPFERVAQRQERERDVVRRQLRRIGITASDVRDDVVVRQHHALGLAGRARGVDDRRERFVVDRGAPCLDAPRPTDGSVAEPIAAARDQRGVGDRPTCPGRDRRLAARRPFAGVPGSMITTSSSAGSRCRTSCTFAAWTRRRRWRCARRSPRGCSAPAAPAASDRSAP